MRHHAKKHPKFRPYGLQDAGTAPLVPPTDDDYDFQEFLDSYKLKVPTIPETPKSVETEATKLAEPREPRES